MTAASRSRIASTPLFGSSEHKVVSRQRPLELVRQSQQGQMIPTRDDTASPPRARLRPSPDGRLGDLEADRDLGQGEGSPDDLPRRDGARARCGLAAGDVGVGRGVHAGRVADDCATRNLLPFDRRWYTDRLAARNLSQRKLAKRLDLDPAQVSRIFNGHRPLRLDEVPVLARLLDVSVVDIIERAGVPLARR